MISLDSGEPRAVACDVISPKARLPLEQRLEFIFSELGDVIARFQPTAMAVEEPFVGTNVRSAHGDRRGADGRDARGDPGRHPVHHYPPARIKASVAGYGQGEKTQVREMLRLQLGMAEAPADLNASDALAVALCHAIQHAADELLSAAGA